MNNFRWTFGEPYESAYYTFKRKWNRFGIVSFRYLSVYVVGFYRTGASNGVRRNICSFVSIYHYRF